MRAERPTIDVSRVREIGWSKWDPIGIATIEGEGWQGSSWADEYDAYLLEAISLLRSGRGLAHCADYLVKIEAEYIGLGIRADTVQRATDTVTALNKYLGEFPCGPLKVR